MDSNCYCVGEKNFAAVFNLKCKNSCSTMFTFETLNLTRGIMNNISLKCKSISTFLVIHK